MAAILGKKLGMTQVFREDGTVVPVTVIEAGPCKVTAVRDASGTATRPCSSPSARSARAS